MEINQTDQSNEKTFRQCVLEGPHDDTTKEWHDLGVGSALSI